MADKNLMKRTAANANRLQEVGNDIDQAATGTLADDTAALLAEFDATKYTEGPTSQLLNEGAEQMHGAKVKPVADRIRRQLIEAAEGTPAPAKVAEEVVEEAPQLTRRQKISKIAKTAAEKGEARPPSTPLVDSPDPGRLDVDNDRADVGLLKVLDNEARLGGVRRNRQRIGGDKLEAERAAIGYDEMTFEEKKANGLLKPVAGYANDFDPLAEIISNRQNASRCLRATRSHRLVLGWRSSPSRTTWTGRPTSCKAAARARRPRRQRLLSPKPWKSRISMLLMFVA